MIDKYWSKLEDIFMGIFSAMALLIICYEVIARYFFPSILTDWGSEVIIYCVVWAVLLAGSQLVRDGRHINADLVVSRFPQTAQRVLEIVNMVVGLVYCTIIAYFGYEAVSFGFMLDERSESSLMFPLAYYYIIIPLAFGLMSIRYVVRLFWDIRNFNNHNNDDNVGESELSPSQK